MNADLTTPDDKFRKEAREYIERLEAELDSTQFPFERCDRKGTRQRAAVELADREFLINARLNDKLAQMQRWREAMAKSEAECAELQGLAVRAVKIRERYLKIA